MSVDSDIGSGSDRSPSYNIGGAPPYGWTGTPGYNPFQAPSEKETFGEVALYERMDWTGGVTADAAQKELQNPPFIGVGSTSARVPGHMANSSNPAIPHRILRGYMRRFDTNPASTDNASDPSKSYKARLFFMWNPQFIERTYAALEDIQQFLNLTNQANGPVNNEDTQPYLKTEVGFSLVFDRQEEVNRFPNHPGCLVDLAVFDLLSRGGSPAGQMTKEALKALDDAGGTVAGGPSSKSLIFNPGIKIAVIFSPYIVYFGNIIDVRATFEKFSHRMTPTRMTLDLKMRLYAFGSLNQLKASDQAAVSSSASAAAYQAGPLGAVDPTTVTAKSQDEKDRLNIQGARDAMSWGEHWIGKVNYEAGATRCANAGADSYDKPDSNIPLAFDCSSFVARCFCVIGWGPTLGIDPCSDTNGFETAIKNNPSAWYVYWFSNEMMRAQNNGSSTSAVFTVLTSQIRPGDCILRSGTGPNGHIAFIHAVIEAGKTYEILHTNTSKPPNNKVHLDTYTLDHIVNGDGNSMKPYTHLIRAQPIPLVKPAEQKAAPSNPAPQMVMARSTISLAGRF